MLRLRKPPSSMTNRDQPKMDSRGGPKLMHTQGSLPGSPYQQKPDLAFITDKRPVTGALDKTSPDKTMTAFKENVQGQQGFRRAYRSAGSHPDVVSGATIVWPPMAGKNGTAHERALFFASLGAGQRAGPVHEREARTLYDLMLIRGCNSKLLQHYSSILGTALGLRTTKGLLTTQPAIVVYVSRKVNQAWLDDHQTLPNKLRGPDGLWCDLDVIEFADGTAQKAESYSGLADGLRGGDTQIGPGSQVATSELYGTLGAIVRCRSQKRLGFLTNRHVSVDLDQPLQKLYHPLPPVLGANVYLGTVERAVSYATDHLWYGKFCSPNPDSFVRADGAYVPFADDFNLRQITPEMKGIGKLGPVMEIDLELPVTSIVGKKVHKVGRTTGLTTGVIMACSVEYDDDKGITIYTDFLVLGDKGNPFDAEGDSGSLIVMHGEDRSLPRPIGLVWGGTVNHGRLKLRDGAGPENWTSGIGLARLLDLLDVDLVTSLDQSGSASFNPTGTETNVFSPSADGAT